MGYILGFLAVLIVGAFVDGYVLKTLWAWFVAPTFNLPLLTLVQATGISLLVEAITYRYSSTNKEDELKSMAYQLFMPVLILGIGFIVRLFM